MIANPRNELELQLLARLKNDCEASYSILFHKYYKDLVLYAGNIIRSKSTCEDIIQNIFLKLWDDRNDLAIDTSLKSYLLTAVRNSCLDELRHQKVVNTYEADIQNQIHEYEIENYILYSDLYGQLLNAVEQLPEKHREVFKLSRFDNLKHKEIAQKLDVSERTVEERIKKALIQLRINLKEFFIAIYIFFLLFCC